MAAIPTIPLTAPSSRGLGHSPFKAGTRVRFPSGSVPPAPSPRSVPWAFAWRRRMKIDSWILYTLLAGLAWGTYVPLIFYGGSELGGKPGARIMAILCVGVAYFVIAVLFPLYLFLSGQ